VFAGKGTATLIKRHYDLDRLADHVKRLLLGWPPSVSTMLGFFKTLRAPTAPQSVCSAMRFGEFVAGFRGLADIANHRLVRQTARQRLSMKGAKRERGHLERETVVTLQDEVADIPDDESPFDEQSRWYQLIAFATAGRFIDVSHVVGFTPYDAELVQVVTTKAKNWRGRVDEPLVMLAPIRLFRSFKWVDHFRRFRSRHGMDDPMRRSVRECYKSPLLFPIVAAWRGNRFVQAHAAADALNEAIRETARKRGDQRWKTRSSHGPKHGAAAIVSALDAQARAKFLHHRIQGEPSSTVTYDVDRLVGPVRSFGKLLESSPGCEWPKHETMQDSDVEAGSISPSCDESASKDGSSEDPDLESWSRLREVTFEEAAEALEATVVREQNSGKFFAHMSRGTLHAQRRSDSDLAVCGRPLDPEKHVEICITEFSNFSKCMDCFRP